MPYRNYLCSRPRLVLYGSTHGDVDELEALLSDVLRSRGEHPVIESFVGTLPYYLEYTRRNPYLILVAAAPGADGPDIVRKIRENNPAARLVWLCGKEYAKSAYRIRPTALEEFPATREAVERAMDECGLCGIKAGQEVPTEIV